MTAAKTDPRVDLANDIAGFTHDPLGYAVYAFPWNEPGTALASISGPRVWQRQVMTTMRDHLRDPATRHQPLRIAVASGHGIGKSALIAMVTKWALDTCEDARVIITANTEGQLHTKTSPEISKWARLAITADWFKPTTTAVISTEKGHEKEWRADLVTWSANNTEAFAGLHNLGKRIVVIYDEASGIDAKVWEVTLGALTDEDTEIIWIAFGNPTQNVGAFRDCFGKHAALWKTMQIDSRTVEGTNKPYLDELVETYGEDSDTVKVRVRGMFPSASLKQYISTADVDAAYGKHLLETQYNWAPKILTLDNAWEGDDELVIGLRQGLAFKILHTAAKNDNDIAVANILARYEDEEGADAVFIDAGYGTGVVSAGRTFKRNWTLVWFSGESSDPGCLNKRAEMWKLGRDWLKAGGAIPPDPVLHADLIGPETVPRVDGKLLIESKKDMKGRGLKSPNRADALILSFAYPVSAKIRLRGGLVHPSGPNMITDYDPYA